MTNEATELRVRAEHWRMMASAYDVHVRMVNSPVAQEAYETALKAAMDAYDALSSAAEKLDDQLALPLAAKPVPVGFGISRVFVG